MYKTVDDFYHPVVCRGLSVLWDFGDKYEVFNRLADLFIHVYNSSMQGFFFYNNQWLSSSGMKQKATTIPFNSWWSL